MKKIILLLLALALNLFILNMAYAQWQTIYQNDFTSGSLPTNIFYINGSWSIEEESGNNYLHGPAGENIWIWMSMPEVSRTIRLEADVRFRGPGGDEYVRALGAGSNEIFNNTYSIVLDTGLYDTQYVMLDRFEDQGTFPANLGSSGPPLNFTDGSWHSVALELTDDGQVYGYYDGQLRVSATDLTYNTFNLFYIGTSGGSAYDWDNIKVSVVPEPISSILFLTGGAVLTVRRYLKGKK